MALTKFGFIVKGDGLDPATHRQVMASSTFEMLTVGVGSCEEALPVAQEMVASGTQLIELCGGFGPIWTSRLIEAIDGAVPIGAVAYGPEAIDQLHAIFAD